MRSFAWFVAVACAGGATAGSAAATTEGPRVEDVALQVPFKDVQGNAWTLRGHVCRLATDANAPLAVVNHGSIADARERATMAPESCDGPISRWFVAHGFAAVFVLRLGHGATGGPWIESFDCTRAGFARSGRQTARQIEAIVDAARKLPHAADARTVVVGVSAGGWGTIAYASTPHPGVVAAINISGGRGGHYRGLPNSNCHPEHLIEAAADFGKTATLPMLWVYARNDSYFGPALAQSLQQAFNAAGGEARLVETDAFGSEGHALFYAGDEVWGSLFAEYLSARDALPAPAARNR